MLSKILEFGQATDIDTKMKINYNIYTFKLTFDEVIETLRDLCCPMNLNDDEEFDIDINLDYDLKNFMENMLDGENFGDKLCVSMNMH